MIHFMYHDTYDASVLPADEQAILLHIHVFALARKYFIQPLEELAQKNTLEALKEWNTIVFAQAVKEIYALTAHTSEACELRAATTFIVRKNAVKLFGPDCEPHHYLMQDIFEATPGFMSDLATAMAARSHSQAGLIEGLQSTRRDDRAARDWLLRTKNEQKNLLDKTRLDLSATEADLVRTRGELSSTKTQLSATKSQLGRANSEATKLRVETSEQPKYIMAFVPRYTKSQGGSDMKWYLCPNCNTVFSRSICPGLDYIHPCYSASWVGAMGTSTVRMNCDEWAQHVYSVQYSQW